MAKTIKFNLICDNKPVRTLEDLRNNFSVEDVLAYYENGLLSRWLSVRGYEEELAGVMKIKTKDSIGIAKKLIKIFQVECDEKEIEKSVYILEYEKEKMRRCESYHEKRLWAQNVIRDYEGEYNELVVGILDNPKDIARIKANIAAIAEDYKWILKLDHRRLYYTLRKEKAYLAIMCLLMNEETRPYYLWTTDTAKNQDITAMYKSICDILLEADFKEIMGDNLRSFSGRTDQYWRDIEQKGKKYMIIQMSQGDYVRSSGELNGDLGYDEIKFSFMILDGIDYKCNMFYHELLYMEV